MPSLEGNVAISLARLQTFQYVQAASMMLLIHDWAILFGEEVDLVWRARWTIPKTLFLITRYAPFIDMVVNLYHSLNRSASPETCQATYAFISWSMTIGVALSEIVMLLRTYAILDCSRRVLIGLGSFWIVSFILSMGFVGASVKAPSVDTGIRSFGCSSEMRGMAIQVGAFASLLCMETLIVILTIRKAFQLRNSRYRLGSLNLIFNTLYLDGIFFYIIILLFSYINIIFVVMSSRLPEIAHIFVAPMRVFHGLLSCRMLLNIRRVAMQHVPLPLPTHLHVPEPDVYPNPIYPDKELDWERPSFAPSKILWRSREVWQDHKSRNGVHESFMEMQSWLQM